MDFLQRSAVNKSCLPGRVIQNVVGKQYPIESGKMTVCFAHYSAESGPMEPHNHAEETVVVLSAENSYVLWGSSKDCLEHKQVLQTDDVMHFAELEWHVFRYEKGGHLDALCIYGQVDNIRPEEIQKN
ncbi:MAG: hypothetical protein E7476_14005 [Ruminococcaceae bacterium]|nr:hypothetical protein [Oscillospiraceae bacterium]